MGTPECERGFSEMNLIRTKLRNSLSIELNVHKNQWTPSSISKYVLSWIKAGHRTATSQNHPLKGAHPHDSGQLCSMTGRSILTMAMRYRQCSLTLKKLSTRSPHQRLINKLHDLNLPSHIIALIHSYLYNRHQQVCVNGTTSSISHVIFWCAARLSIRPSFVFDLCR